MTKIRALSALLLPRGGTMEVSDYFDLVEKEDLHYALEFLARSQNCDRALALARDLRAEGLFDEANTAMEMAHIQFDGFTTNYFRYCTLTIAASIADPPPTSFIGNYYPEDPRPVTRISYGFSKDDLR